MFVNIFAVVCCYINVADLCSLDSNTITNKEIKANIKASYSSQQQMYTIFEWVSGHETRYYDWHNDFYIETLPYIIIE